MWGRKKRIEMSQLGQRWLESTHSRYLVVLLLTAFTAIATAQITAVRPKITGISHVAVYTTDPGASDRFYTRVLGAAKLPDPENPAGVRYAVSSTQFIEVLPLPADAGIKRMDHTAWNTESAEGMRTYLAAKGWKTPARVEKGADGSRWFAVSDPEGNTVQFVQPAPHPMVDAPFVMARQIVHFGFIVHSRAIEDTFYRALLDFRPYWFGGMSCDKLDWVSQQSPEGHNWLEYMLLDGPPAPGFPPGMTQQKLGAADHFGFGVPDVDLTLAVLKAGGRVPEMIAIKTGRTGKRVFQFFDPDGTRIEVANYLPSEKPSCSPFTAEHPSE